MSSKINKIIEKHHFQTGDILLFCSNSNGCVDKLIKFFTNSKFTHAGMIIHNPPWRKDLQGYFLLESNRENINPDAEDNEIKVGVELTNLEEVFDYNADIYWRHISVKRDEDFESKLINAHSKVHNDTPLQS